MLICETTKEMPVAEQRMSSIETYTRLQCASSQIDV